MEIAPPPPQVASVWSRCEEGRQLLAALPRVMATLCERFELTAIGAPWSGGWVGYVVPAERGDGTPAVLKLSLGDEECVLEADALALWDGDGAVRLLDRVTEPNAMLLERCQPGTPLQALPDREAAISVACGVLRRLERPLADGHPFLPVARLAGRYGDWIPTEFRRLGSAFDPGLAALAAELCTSFARDQSPPFLVNRDFHLGNVLAAQREPWLTIDPKPLAGPRAFDTGHLLRDLLPSRLATGIIGRTVARLADELQLAPADVRDWALVRSVENALWCLDDGDDATWDVAVAAELSALA
jgi:streptomycin 6-kinase